MCVGVTFVVTGLISMMAGSYWTTVGTIGVAMLSAGKILGIQEGWLAGAIISGAYFGDKVSPLSDTTNLSASVAGVNLYKHVKFLLITNIPLFIITAIFFGVSGYLIETNNSLNIKEQCDQIAQIYNISPWLLLLPAFTIFLIYKKISPYLTLSISAIIGSIMVVIVQPQIADQISSFAIGSWESFVYVPLKLLSGSVDINTGNQMLDGLVNTRGMAGMLNTIWLIMCVVAFGGIMEGAGFITVITNKLLSYIKGTLSLVGATMGSCIICNIILSDQYIAILIPGKMFNSIYKEEGYEPELLSRSLQDSATVTSVLIPWNTCAVVQTGVLGVPTLTYLPYCFFNIASPFVSLFVAAIGYKITKFGKPVNKKVD